MNNSYAFVDPSYDDFLMHYRIKDGSKNGVRRWENYDGHLTPAGKERYSVYWEKGVNLKGKKVDYDGKKYKTVKEALNIGTARYEKADGSLTAEGKKKFGDILTKNEMTQLVRNYNKTNGTKYKVGEVTFRKNGKLYSPEGKRVNENTEIDPVGVARIKKTLFGQRDKKDVDKSKGLIGNIKDNNYKKQVRNMKEMSDDDIKKAIDRTRLEKEYMRELGIQKSAGAKFLDSLKSSTGSVAADLAKDFAKEAGYAFLNQVVKPKFYEATGFTPKTADKFAEAKKEAQYEWDRLNALKYKKQREGMEGKGADTKPNQNGNNNTQQPQQPEQKGQPQQKGQAQQEAQQGQPKQEKKPKK